ncbi:UDPGT domain containing protein [Asbolus verrucosus]|uniref:UDP-glucuronosyltransferase n=1 Tax=Asbolus verrucosus TaxID=1661398 RepID=A0A482VRP4_ASBVE|nr:UDPGT domain containing protein [Asbolus verrucosus]
MFPLSVIVVALLPLVQTSNILFVAVSPSVSHQIVFQAVWKELSLKGHNVHVITPNPLRDPTLHNLVEIDISSLYDKMREVPRDVAKYLLKKPDFFNVFLKDRVLTEYFSKFMEYAFQHEHVQKFLSEQHEFDVVIVEWLYPTMAAFGAKYNCPIIGITSLGAPIPALDTVGNPSHPVYVPDHNLPVKRDLNFKERLMSTLYSIFVRVYYHFVVLPREDALAKKYLGEGLPYMGDIEKNVSLLLLNRNLVFHRIGPSVPAIIDLGGIQLNKTKKDLEPELKKFLDNSVNGAIYFSLGSNMKSIYLPEATRNIFRDTFAQLPYNVVWKWEGGDLPGAPNNVFTQSWIPQVELLGHPNLKLFITQGGLQSTEDAIKNHVPIIGIPFHSDQTTNVDTSVKYGIGIGIDLDEINIENLNASVHQIINDARYKENVVRLDKIMHDQPKDGLERAVWWTEYVIRHKGAKHLRSHSMDVPWIQYLMIDIAAFLAGTLFFIIFIVYQSLKLISFIIFWILRKLLRCKTDRDKKNK